MYIVPFYTVLASEYGICASIASASICLFYVTSYVRVLYLLSVHFQLFVCLCPFQV